MKNALVMLTVLWLAGCASVSYQEPTQGPRARVRFVTTSSQITVLRAYDDVNCAQNEAEWMRLRVGFLVNSSPKTLGIPLSNYHENSAKENYVEANKRIHAMFFGGETVGATTYSCGTPFSFSFSENSDYEVRFQWDPNQCRVTISQLVRKEDSWSLAEVARFDNRANALNRGCLAQFRKTRLY
jgi:hypothetical protein